MRRLIMMLAVFGFLSLTAQEKKGSIIGVVTESNTGEPIPFANVSLFQNSIQLYSTTTDFDGKYSIKSIDSGVYHLQVSYVGFQTKAIQGIVISANRITKQNINLSQGIALKSVEIIQYKKPLNRFNVFGKRNNRMAVRSASNISKTAGNGTYSRDNGELNKRGSRDNPQLTFIDGVKIMDSDLEEGSTFFEGEEYQEIIDNPFELSNVAPLSTISIDVDRAAYANTRRYINDGYLPPVSAVRIEEMINYFDYDYPQPQDDHPFTITTEYSDCPWNKNRKIALIGIQGKDIILDEAPKSNLVFLIDASGSMNSHDKLALLKNGLELLVDQLRDEDKLSIVVYAGAAGVVLPPTSGREKEKIKSVLNQLNAGGSTAGGEGIKLAYELAEKNFRKDGNNRIILATDGDFNVGVSSQEGLVKLIEKEREKGVFLSVLGFGSGNLQDYKMEQLADKGNGNYNYIDNLLEAKKVLVNEMGGTLITIAKDVKIQAEFNPKLVKAYRLIGYVNRALEDEDFNNDRKDAGELGAGHTVTVLYEIIPSNSTEIGLDIDPLKYQEGTINEFQEFSDEVLTVKFRYKKPDEDKSNLLVEVLKDQDVLFENTSLNFKFSLSVASFGMLLRDSESVKDYNFDDVLQLAKESKGQDENGYRSEFIRLVEMAELIK